MTPPTKPFGAERLSHCVLGGEGRGGRRTLRVPEGKRAAAEDRACRAHGTNLGVTSSGASKDQCLVHRCNSQLLGAYPDRGILPYRRASLDGRLLLLEHLHGLP